MSASDEVRPNDPQTEAVERASAETGNAARETAAMHARLFEWTPRVWVTPLIVALNVAVFIGMAASGISPIDPLVERVIDWGANWGPRTAHGEWWRLFTSMFLHYGVIHIGLNMWVLWDAGKLTERIYGNVPFLVLYLGSGLIGSAASVGWSPESASAGASGAVFGVYGGLLAFVRGPGKAVVPTAALQSLRKSGGAFVFYNVVFGLISPGIDNAAHLGGLAGGYVIGKLVASLRNDGSRVEPGDRVGGMGMTALLVIAAAVGGLMLGSRVPSHHGLAEFEAGYQALQDEDWEGARDHFTRSLELAPQETGALFNRSIAREHLGDLAGAIADVQAYVDAVPDDPEGPQRLRELEAR